MTKPFMSFKTHLDIGFTGPCCQCRANLLHALILQVLVSWPKRTKTVSSVFAGQRAYWIYTYLEQASPETAYHSRHRRG